MAGAGYYYGMQREIDRHKADMLEVLEQAQERRAELQLSLAERDEALVEALSNVRTEYKTVVRKIPVTVDADCAIPTERLQKYTARVRAANRRRGYDGSLRSDP